MHFREPVEIQCVKFSQGAVNGGPITSVASLEARNDSTASWTLIAEETGLRRGENTIRV